MLITRMRSASLVVVVAAFAALVPITRSQEINHASASPALARGRQILSANCAACHGIDGKGSVRAPNIADSPSVLQLSDAQLLRIIDNGIPGTGMPAFRSLSAAQVRNLVSYLRSLARNANNAKLPGDPKKGEPIFFEKAGCSHCHMIAGRGGFIASDLTGYARTHSTDQIRNAILASRSERKEEVKLATAILRSGDKYVGRIRNEDNFSLQLQLMDGSFISIAKVELAKLDFDPRPLMPDNFGSLLTAEELNNLIGYLLSAAGNADPHKRANDYEMDNLED